MKLIKYFVMPITNNYSIKEEYILSLIELYSDSKVSHITRESLCKISGIKSVDVITKYTNKFEKDGYITKKYSHLNGKKYVEYHLKKSKSYIVVYNSVLKFGECAALAFKLAPLRVGGTSEIQLSNNQIVKKLGLDKATYRKYRDQLLSNGILIETDKGYALNTDYFPIFKTDELTEKDKSTIQALKGENNKLGKQIDWFLSLPEEDQTHSLFNEILAGLIKSNLHSLPAELLI